MNVLIIDDEEDARFILRISLGRVGGMNVSEATSGDEGVTLAKNELPDVIILDVTMPGMDGKATFRALHDDARTASIPIVFLTGNAREASVADLQTLGPKAILRKPFDPLRLADQLRELLAT